MRDLGDDRHPQPAEVIATLAADGVEHGLLTLPDVGQRYPDGVDVESARQPAIRRDQDQQPFFDRPLGQERMRRPGTATGHLGEHLGHSVRVGAGGFGPGLHPPQFGCGDGLHGSRDLLRVLQAGDAAADLGESGQAMSP